MTQAECCSDEPGEPSILRPSNTVGVTHAQASQHLQSVRARLSHTIQDYLAACELVQKTCNTSNGSSVERQQALLAIDAELSTFAVEEGRFQQARNALVNARNVSRMVAPIYSLPTETLARIFSDAACYCKSKTFHSDEPDIANPVTLSGVCRRWRRVAVNHRPLWTHIDLVVTGDQTNRGYHPPEIWEERSQGALLYLNIYQYHLLNYSDAENDEFDNDIYPDEIDSAPMFDRLLTFLSPLMS
ncbi:hypothetical protein FRC09_018820 [Ceratobasidium sp. 395]|nr:hypothetical protein FRC09_018820 [Ceratobasidium sp. 395]